MNTEFSNPHTLAGQVLEQETQVDAVTMTTASQDQTVMGRHLAK